MFSKLHRLTVFLLLLASVSGALACTLRPHRLERRLHWANEPEEGEYPRLRDPLFARRARFTGILRADRFNDVLGFWIFLREPHQPERMPVLFVHGVSAGPRPLKTLADSLDPERFEPWFCYYATGTDLDRSAALLRQSLAETAARYEERTVAVVAYSLGGLVMRQALRPADDGLDLPRIPLVINVSVPWAGSRHRRLEQERRTFNPDSFVDLAAGSDFLQRLFDDPLPEETTSHVLYGLGGRDRRRLPGEDDTVLTEETLSRPEALAEAESETILPEAAHLGVIRDPQTLSFVNSRLDELWTAEQERSAAPTD